ncbi:MAG: sulfatase-like hydrolase/transferase [Rhodobacteraceae bacterium]|nr:sulfatase-like hydrolase/transferase [Paracoccaceae bacterium]
MYSLLGLPSQAEDLGDGRRPNVLFLLTDDQRPDTIAALGNRHIKTPALDQLVRRGTTFTRAYNMGSWSGAVCVASRTMLITGRSVWNANSIYNATDKERQAGVLWPQLMAEAGYRTYFTGKWHIKTDAEKCFDVARHVRPGMPKDTPNSYNRPPATGEDTWSPYDTSLGGFWEGGKHWSEVVADDAVDYLGDAKQAGKPFFMYIAFNAPHDPRQAPKEYVDRYPLDRIAVPKNFIPQYPHMEEIGSGTKLRDEKLGPFPRTEHAVKVHRQEYYALITHLDAQIGRILDTLDQSGQADSTWIFFTADHGLAVGHHGLFGKQNMYDHSVRVPFIVAGPGVAKNKRKRRGDLFAGCDGHVARPRRGEEAGARLLQQPPSVAQRKAEGVQLPVCLRRLPRTSALHHARRLEAHRVSQGRRAAPLPPRGRPDGDARPRRRSEAGEAQGGVVPAPRAVAAATRRRTRSCRAGSCALTGAQESILRE